MLSTPLVVLTFSPIRDWLPLPFTHLTAICQMFNPYILLSSFNTKSCLWATWTRHASLIHRFLCFTTKVLLVFRRFDHSTTCCCPNSDSALGVNHRLYYDPTRTLLLLAINEALRLRFGVSPSSSNKSPYLIQCLSASIPASFDLTYSSHLSNAGSACLSLSSYY